MSDTPMHARDYCADMVKQRDEDRWLAAHYANENDCRKLLALYAFQCELRRIPSAVSEPALGEIRLQWWREAFDEMRGGKPVRAHPVVEELTAAGFGEARFAEALDAVIDAHARPLYGEGFGDIDDLSAWLGKTDGALDALALTALASPALHGETEGGAAAGGEDARSAAAGAGAGFALAREGRALAPRLAEEIPAKAVSLAEAAGPALKKIPGDHAPAVLHLALTRDYARRADGPEGARPFPAVKRLRLFGAMAFGWF